MGNRAMPVGKWMVVETAPHNGFSVLSIHATQRDAEAERDRRNAGLTQQRFRACIALQPVAERMGCPLVEPATGMGR
jgi:hypothetical protein